MDLDAITLAEVIAAIGGNRVFQYEQEGGDDVRFSYNDSLGYVFLLSSRIMQTYWDISTSSPDDFNATNFSTALDEEVVTVNEVTDAQEKPPFGSKDIEILAMRVQLDSMTLETEGDTPIIKFKDEQQRSQKLIVGAGMSVDFDDLQNSSVGVKRPPTTWGVNAIHFGAGETEDGTLRLPNPVDQIPVPGNDLEYTFHNRNSTYNLEVKDWADDNIATLLPGERLTIRMTRRADGTGELIDSVPFSRKFEFAKHVFSDFAGARYYNLGTTGGFRGRLVPFPTESNADLWTMHEECFQLGDTAVPNATNIFSASVTNLRTPSSIIFQKEGTVRVDMFLAISTAGGGGQIPDNHGLSFFRLDGATVRQGPYLSNEQTGINENEVWKLSWEFDVQLADIFIPVFRYHESVSMAMSSVDIESLQMQMEMTEFINREYTP